MGMKIESKLVNKTVPFQNIKVGDFFLDGDGDLCVRISDIYTQSNVYCFPCKLLLDGYDIDTIIPVDVTITVDRYAS